jgi:phytoene synthase
VEESLTTDGLELLRRFDRDRFLTALFAPPALRAALLALYAFNLEVARVGELVSEPMIGEIRLAWWREAVEDIYQGKPARHGVLETLSQSIPRLPRALFDRLIDARVRTLEETSFATLDDLLAFAGDSSSTLAELALRLLLGEVKEEALAAARQVGMAWALAGILRAIPYHAHQGRVLLPGDLLGQHGVDPQDILQGRSTAGLREVVCLLHGAAAEALLKARALRPYVPRAGVPALLLAPLASGYLRALKGAGFDPFAANYERGAAWRFSVLMIRGAMGRY